MRTLIVAILHISVDDSSETYGYPPLKSEDSLFSIFELTYKTSKRMRCCRRKKSTRIVGSEISETKFSMVLRELSHETFSEYDQKPPSSYHTMPLTISDYFEIGSILGSGETCVVFAGTFIPTKEKVAIKYLTDYSKHRFYILRELQVLKISEQCPYLVRYHSHFRVKDMCYIVTEQLYKHNFSELLYPKMSLPPNLIKIYTKQLSKAVIYLHYHKIIHRDITLNNLVPDFYGNLRLIDYSLSFKMVGSGWVRFPDLGTFQFAAPEVYKDKLCGYTVDWWSVGVCLYRFVTGGYPFHTTNQRVYSYYVINTHTVVYPPEFFRDFSMRDLTDRLLAKKSCNRMGYLKDNEIKSHPYFADVDWAEEDSIQEVILNSDIEDLKFYREAYKSILSVLDELLRHGSTSADSRKWSIIESILSDKSSTSMVTKPLRLSLTAS